MADLVLGNRDIGSVGVDQPPTVSLYFKHKHNAPTVAENEFSKATESKDCVNKLFFKSLNIQDDFSLMIVEQFIQKNPTHSTGLEYQRPSFLNLLRENEAVAFGQSCHSNTFESQQRMNNPF